jgi:hypothetical protein
MHFRSIHPSIHPPQHIGHSFNSWVLRHSSSSTLVSFRLSLALDLLRLALGLAREFRRLARRLARYFRRLALRLARELAGLP